MNRSVTIRVRNVIDEEQFRCTDDDTGGGFTTMQNTKMPAICIEVSVVPVCSIEWLSENGMENVCMSNKGN